jgi:uncharacterized protein YggE
MGGVMNRKITVIGFTFLAFFLLAGCDSEKQKNQSTVSVSGIGTVLVQPDMVQMNINFSHVASTTKQAKDEVDGKVQQVIKILKEENIEDKNIKTVSLSYYVETEYKGGRSVWVGQRAQQTIVVTIHDIINNPNKLPSLLDKIIAIDRVEIRNIKFDNENKTELFKQSRELAYQKALDKANQYAQMAGRKIIKALTVVEEKSRDVFVNSLFQSNVASVGLAYEGQSSVPTGEQEVTSEVVVTFLME